MILAINTGDSKDKYLDYVKANQYPHMRVARDSSREISKMYRVRGIPATYILDKEGVIRHAHLGYGEGMEETFVQEVKSLLQ